MASGRKRDRGLIPANDDNVIKRPLEEVMHESIIPYAEYVIMERALPGGRRTEASTEKNSVFHV